MDDTLINNINELVRPDDVLWHLGDWCWGDWSLAKQYRRRINCESIYLILGNHDKKIRRVWYNGSDNVYKVFRSIAKLDEVQVNNGQEITLCHYSMRVWDKSHHGSWHLYGHSHGSLPDDPHSLSFDVGVDCHNYKPINLGQVDKIMSKKTFKPVDGHTGERREKMKVREELSNGTN